MTEIVLHYTFSCTFPYKIMFVSFLLIAYSPLVGLDLVIPYRIC